MFYNVVTSDLASFNAVLVSIQEPCVATSVCSTVFNLRPNVISEPI